MFYNVGTVPAFVVTGDSSIVATLPAVSGTSGTAGNGTPIPPGQSINLKRGSSDTYWAVICRAAETADVYCTTGSGE